MNLTGPLSLRFPIVVVVPAPGPVNAVSDPVPRPLRLPSVVPVNHETVTVESLGPPGEEPGKPATVYAAIESGKTPQLSAAALARAFFSAAPR